MFRKLKRLRSKLLNFNQFSRDEWVAARAAEIPSGSKVIDIGAGACRYRLLFSHCNYYAQDFCGLKPETLKYGNINMISDAASLPIMSRSFDVVLCTEVLEHQTNPIEVAREIARVLRPGGQLILTAPLGSGIHQFPYHYYGGFTPYWYEFFLAKVGFCDIQIEANGGFFKHYGQETIRIVDFFISEKSRVGKRILRPILTIPLCYLIPAVCHALDPLDHERRFTVGYFVRAQKRDDATE